jgi:tetratricopeptide (TPR) repeat protein
MKLMRYQFVLTMLLLAACQTAGQVTTGRQALLLDNYEEALSRFQAAADADPSYFYRSGPFHETIWTYVGRTQYHTGRFAEARRSLERALSLDKDDYLAHIYLGLTLVRTGDRSAGLREIDVGMRGLHDWLEYLNYNTQYYYWDINREIRNQIERDLADIDARNIDWPRLVANAEWLGKKTEEEVDLARKDEQLQRQFRDDRFRGRGVGLGVGF